VAAIQLSSSVKSIVFVRGEMLYYYFEFGPQSTREINIFFVLQAPLSVVVQQPNMIFLRDDFFYATRISN
jgi:hypothetical protein